MSSTEQKETEVVAGVIEGVTQKKPDTWQVAVKPDGSQYTKNLWTKDAELVQALTAKLGQAGAFVCGASYWTNSSGTEVRSLWINSEAMKNADIGPLSENAEQVDRPGSIVVHGSGSAEQGMTKQEWAQKDSAIHKMACIKTAAAALTHTLPSDPTYNDMTRFIERVFQFTVAWHQAVLAERDDPTGIDIPFSEETPDQSAL